MSTVQLTEDKTYIFKPSDFTTATLAGVQVTSLPTTRTLYDNGVAVTLNQIIKASDISSGLFTFVPNTDVATTGSFTDVVGTTVNGSLVKTNSSMTLSVTPDAGASALASSITATENQTYVFALSNFGY